MKNLRKSSRRAVSAMLTAVFLSQQTMVLSAFATNITNVQGNNGVYNINPTAVLRDSDIGLRKYERFELSKGDIANLIYKYGSKDVNTFLNLVDNTIRIDGIVNTMRNGNFYNGKAVFISPNGMVVGASGVLNVGSLGVYTPNQDVYNRYKNNPSKDFSALSDKNNVGSGSVQINGHVFAANDIDVVSSRVQVPGKVLAGTGNTAVFDGSKSADALFNSIVNTSNINSANSINASNGVISFASTVGTAVSGDVQNVGKGSTNITNTGAQGINISGNIANHNGDININNTAGSVFAASTADISNSGGTLKIVNTGKGIYFVKGSDVTNNGNISMSNTGSEGTILSGTVNNTGNTNIDNKAGVLSVSGSLTNKGNATLTNSGEQLNISGTVKNTNGKLTLNNSGAKGLNLISTSTVTSEGIEMNNSGAGGLNINGKVNNTGNAKVTNTSAGVEGLNINGTFTNKGVAEFKNDGRDGLNVTGTLTNTNGKLSMTNNGARGLNVTQKGSVNAQGIEMANNGANGLNVYGTVNNTGDGTYTSNAGALDVHETGKMSNKGGTAKYTNKGANGLVISGEVNNEGTTIANNENGPLSIGGKFTNKGNSTFTNSGEQLNISGTVDNQGKLTLSNSGAKGLNIISSAKVNSEGLEMTNSGAGGLNINGNVDNYGNATVTNTASGTAGLNINGKFTDRIKNNNGEFLSTAKFTNDASGGLNVGKDAQINTNTLIMNNNGEKGLNVNGKIVNSGKATLNNTAGGLNVRGELDNSDTPYNDPAYNGLSFSPDANLRLKNLEITNSGAGGINISGTVKNKADATITNSADGVNGIKISGNIKNTSSASSRNGLLKINNDGLGGINISGNINADQYSDININNTGKNGLYVSGNITNESGQYLPSKLVLTNSGTSGLNITEKGSIISNGNNSSLEITNTGDKGLNIAGKVSNSGNAVISNKEGGRNGLNITGTIDNKNGNLELLNDGFIGLQVREGGVVNAQGLKMVNNGENGLHIKGTVNNQGDGSYTSNAGTFKVSESGKLSNKGGKAEFYNKGVNGFVVAGTIDNEGTSTVVNDNGTLSVGGTFSNKGNTTLTNNGKQLNIHGTVNNSNGVLTLNNTNGDIHIVTTGTVNSEGLKMNNTGSEGINIFGKVVNKGNAEITNAEKGVKGLNVYGSVENTDGKLVLNNDGERGLDVFGKVSNANGKTEFTNNGAGGLNVAPDAVVDTQGLEMTNNGERGMNIWGTVKNQGDGKYTSNAGTLDVKESGKMSNKGGTATYYNKGQYGLVISGEVDNEGTTIATNDNGPLSIGGKFTNKGNATFTNAKGEQLNISGTVTNTDGKLTLNNEGAKGLNIISTGNVNAKDVEMNNSGEAGLNIRGNVKATGKVDITNSEGGKAGIDIGGKITQGDGKAETNGHVNLSNQGEGGINVWGKIDAEDSVTSSNAGKKGTYIDSKASITSGKDISLGDASEGGTKVRGLVNAKDNVYMTEVGGDIILGDGTENDNYITAGKDIDIVVHNGNVKNIGVKKTLLKADGNLDIKVVDGSIGEAPAPGVTRDFKKSVNANIKGKVNEQTIDTTTMKEKDFVINYAAIDSDMNIDTIKADGRVILTVDDDYGVTNDGARYNMVNVKTDLDSTNIEGKGISLISNGSIGNTTTNPDGSEVTTSVTFIQTGAEQGYTMDALANEDISLYENSYNDLNYGRDKEVKANKVTTMIAREGDLEAEFAGNTTIDNITAEGDLIVTTRGQKLEIENLGSIKDGNKDYFGVRNNGEADGGYSADDHKTEVLPNKTELKALDINHNLRPTAELVDGNHEGYAQAEVKVKNAVLDNGKMDITADIIKANGIELRADKNGVVKQRNTETNKVSGADSIPTAHLVREDDVAYVDRSETERNYYRFKGDGDGMYNGKGSNVDSDDDIFDATPLEMEDDINGDASQMWNNKIDGSNVAGADKRQYMRFNISQNQIPVAFEQKAGASSLIDISRGGIALVHEGNLKVGDVIPVHIVYGDLDINADAKIVSATSTRAGAEFINIDKSLANQLLYLNILLESKYNKLANN